MAFGCAMQRILLIKVMGHILLADVVGSLVQYSYDSSSGSGLWKCNMIFIIDKGLIYFGGYSVSISCSASIKSLRLKKEYVSSWALVHYKKEADLVFKEKFEPAKVNVLSKEDIKDKNSLSFDIVSARDKLNGILHPYQKLKSFYKGVLDFGPKYTRDAKTVEWLTHGHVIMHEME
ncbi:hypothetical protein Tco_0713378 [Tanacetum coccineum]